MAMTIFNLNRLSSIKEQLSGLFTISLVMLANLWLLTRPEIKSLQQTILICVLFVAFVIAFLLSTRDRPYRREGAIRTTLLATQYAIVLAIFAVCPYDFNAILLVVWSAQLPYYLPLRVAVVTSPCWSALPWLLHVSVWKTSSPWLSGVLFWTFNVFALLMMESRRQAEQQQLHAEQTTQELRALQNLMQQASRKDERTRIARDIHDVVGHHLTALSLHLQVASRTVDEPHKAVIAQCLSIARLLLADVREAISDMREIGELDLRQAIETLIDPLTQQTDFALSCDNLDGLSLAQAQTLLRCIQESITNSIRHGNASQISIDICREGKGVVARVTDNGRGGEDFLPGNGLTGIQERMALLGGTAQFTIYPHGFSTTLLLPETP